MRLTVVDTVSEAGGAAAASCDPIICRCFKVSRSVIQSAIETRGLRQVDDVTQATDAGGACTCCHRVIQKLLNAHNGEGDMRIPAQLCAAPIK